MARCRCGTGRQYDRCCGPLHAGRPAPDPEALMRSRYCAYAKGLVDYIVATTDPDGPQWNPDLAAWRREIASFSRQTRFDGLRVRFASEHGDEGTVEFEAHLTRDEADAGFAERSRFRRRDGRWAYHSGTPA